MIDTNDIEKGIEDQIEELIGEAEYELQRDLTDEEREAIIDDTLEGLDDDEESDEAFCGDDDDCKTCA